MSCNCSNCTCSTNYSNCGTPKQYVNCCTVMDCIDIGSDDNSLTVVKNDCGVDLSMTGNNLDTIFKLNEDDCISVVKEFIDGVLTYTLQFDESCADPSSVPYTADRGIVENVSHNFRLVESLDGAATKLLWNYPKGAFRAGTTTGVQWNNANIGNYSAAFGIDNYATSIGSFAAGSTNNVISNYSVVFGQSNVIQSQRSAAFGFQAVILPSSNESFVAGNSVTASQPYSAVFGRSSNALGVTPKSIAQGGSFVAGLGNHTGGESNYLLGESNTSNGDFSGALGLHITIQGDYSYATGRGLESSLNSHSLVGYHNDATDTANDTVDSTATDPTLAYTIGVGYLTGSFPNEVIVTKNAIQIYHNATSKFYGAIDQRVSTRGIIPARWATGARPPSPLRGEIGYNTTADKIEYWNGTTWVQL